MLTFIATEKRVKDKKFFYQDFLMDVPCDNDYPVVELKYVNSIANCASFDEKDNLLDYIDGKVRTISFKYLHNLLDIREWEKIFEIISNFKKLIIVDDIEIVNIEVSPMKDFYLKIYYVNLSKYVSCYVYNPKTI